MNKLIIDCEWTRQVKEGKPNGDGSPYNSKNKLVTVQWKDLETGEKNILPFYHKELGVEHILGNRNIVQKILDNTDVLIGHNLKADLSFLLECGFTLPNDIQYWDTMIHTYITNKGLKSPLGLKDLAIKYGLPLKSDILQEYWEKGINTDEVPLKELIEYSLQDLETTYALYNLQQSKTDSDTLFLNPSIRLSNEVLPVIVEMERNGCYIDNNALDSVQKEYVKELNNLTRGIQNTIGELMGDTPININSSDDMTKLLYGFEVNDKNKWVDTLGIGTSERNSVKKRKWPKRLSPNELKKLIKEQTTQLYKTEAEPCKECNGTGKIRKLKKDNTPFKKESVCSGCDGYKFVYVELDEKAGLGLKPISSFYATASGFAADKKVIDQYLSRESLDDETKAFLQALQRQSAITTYLNTFVEGIRNNVREDLLLHTSLNQCITATGRLSSSNPNCFSDDTEILTEDGWKLFKTLTKKEKIAQYDVESEEISFVKPIAWQEYPYYGPMVHIQKSRFRLQPAVDILVTPNHECLLLNRKTKLPYKVFADNYSKDALQLQSGFYKNGKTNWTESKISLYCAFQADGHLRKQDGIIEFTFTKQRKIDRFEWAIENERIPYTKRLRYNGQTRFSISRKCVPEYFTKVFDYKTLFSFTPSCLSLFCKEIMLWDGCSTRNSQYCSLNPHNAEIVQTAFILSGKVAKCRLFKNRYSLIDVCDKRGNLTSNINQKDIQYAGNVYCVTMPKGTVIVKRNGTIVITGQCQNIPRGATFPVKKAFTSRFKEGRILEVDFSGLEYRVAVMLAKCEAGLESIVSGKDRHQISAEIIFGKQKEEYSKEEWREVRQDAKQHSFKPLYFGQSGTEAEKKYYTAFMEEHTGIKKWHQELCDEAIEEGQIKTPTGRIFSFPNAKRKYDGNVTGQTQIVNYPVQSVATADIIWIVIVDIYNEMKKLNVKSKLILQVHDAVLLDIHPEETEIMIKLVKKSFDKVHELLYNRYQYSTKVPIESEMKIGPNWGELKEVKVS